MSMGRRERMIELALEIAADDSHGYSQRRRWPWEGSDFDCSSLMYWCANQAGYDVPQWGYTGTMLADFTAAGFSAAAWDGNIWDCEPGDILLAHNDSRQHTEMYVGDGLNVGAHIAETGDVDGAPGDQTGNEISVAPNWGWWDYVLTPPDDGSSPEPEPEPIADVPMPRYRTAYIEGEEKKWYPWMEGLTDTGGSGDDYAGSEGVPIVDVEFENLGDGGWFSLNVQGIGELGRNVHNSTDNPIIGITVYYDTPEPGKTGYYAAKYQVHWMGDGASWGKWELDDDDGGAGNDADPIDMFRLTLEKL